MQLTNVYDWATLDQANANLKKQIAAAIAVAAVNVLAEPIATEHHMERAAWARKVLATSTSPLEEATQMIWGVLGNATIQNDLQTNGATTDANVQFVVDSLVDTYAS